MSSKMLPPRRQLPKLMACMTRGSLETMRNRTLFNLNVLDATGIRRRRRPLYECLILELKEKGFKESADYLQDLVYDNIQLVSEDDIGLVVDLRNRDDYLEDICARLQKAEKERDHDNTNAECLELLNLALTYAEKGKGVLWLAEKFFLAAIAVASQYMLDGGRQKNCCKYHYAKFLLDKFPEADPDEAFELLSEVRDSAAGRDWPLNEKSESDTESNTESSEDVETVFTASAVQLHRVLLSKVRAVRTEDPAKGERLARLAKRRALDAKRSDKEAEALIEMGVCQLMMLNLNSALSTLEKAKQIHTENNNVSGLCDTKMHMAAVLQKMGKYTEAAELLTEMGSVALRYGRRRQLGRALHLLGELHLRRERPDHGTHHLAEAFACFMGFGCNTNEDNQTKVDQTPEAMGMIYKKEEKEIYEEEAEQSRFMMAVSAGQEYMSSYFNLLRESGTCAVAQTKTIEWKLSKAGWWVSRKHHDLVPCPCPAHRRSPLDVLKIIQEDKATVEPLENEKETRKPETMAELHRFSIVQV